MKCPICNGMLRKGYEPYMFAGVKLGEFEAERCSHCREVFFTESASDEIDRKARELGLWGLGRVSKIGYSGNTLVLRIPKKLAQFVGVERGDEVFVHPEGKSRLIVELHQGKE